MDYSFLIAAICKNCGCQWNVSPLFLSRASDSLAELERIVAKHACDREK